MEKTGITRHSTEQYTGSCNNNRESKALPVIVIFTVFISALFDADILFFSVIFIQFF